MERTITLDYDEYLEEQALFNEMVKRLDEAAASMYEASKRILELMAANSPVSKGV